MIIKSLHNIKIPSPKYQIPCFEKKIYPEFYPWNSKQVIWYLELNDAKRNPGFSKNSSYQLSIIT